MRILFIGGTGNISSECAALLHERGHKIFVVSRRQNSVPAHYRSLPADRKDAASMRKVVGEVRPEVVLNFIGFNLDDVRLDWELFRGITKQYVFISSTTVYAKPHRQLPLTEEAPLGNAFWDYARKKLECERWLLEQGKNSDFPVTIVRPSHTYSKRWIPNPVSSGNFNFAARLLAGRPVFIPDDGENPWTLTAASDFAAGLAGLAGKNEAIGETFHITSDEALTWNQIYAEITGALRIESPDIVKVPTDFICQAAPRMIGPLKGDKAHPGVFDNSKVKRFVPDFQCRKRFAVGVRESAAWLREDPSRQRIDPEIDAVFENVIAAWRRDSGAP